MNRYPLWKYILLAVVLAVGGLYAVPNLFGESPAVQVSTTRGGVPLDEALLGRLHDAIKQAGLNSTQSSLSPLGDRPTLLMMFPDTPSQLQAKDVIQQTLNPDPANEDYVVALNLVSRTPAWLASLYARPMFLGLDLRGGVYFKLQVDMRAALTKKLDALASDARNNLRDQSISTAGVERVGERLEARFADAATRDKAQDLLTRQLPDVLFGTAQSGTSFDLYGELKPAALQAARDNAIKQNIVTLNRRVNELGVAEPIIQQEGADRIVVQLPGVQDTAKAKELLGRTATLEARLVDETATPGGALPYGDEVYKTRQGREVVVKKAVIFTGDNLNDAQAGFEPQSNSPAVFLNLDSKGSRNFCLASRDNIGKRMAIMLFEKGKGEVVTDPVFRDEICGGRVQITGSMDIRESNDVALLLRAGSLAAPMDIIEERTIGPSLGKQNIERGFHAVTWGFVAIGVFMVAYYLLFGLFSTLALAVNLMLLVALLSVLQATLTLPGIAAIALTLGMAIDANVLINERVREELRAGATAQSAIHAGYERAWGTILDSNVTTLIAGVALLIFGSGPVRGFAVVHCLGILTSMFSAVVVSRGLVNLWYGGRHRLQSVSIGQIWRPNTATPGTGATSTDAMLKAASHAPKHKPAK